MAECQLVNLWKLGVGGNVTDLRMSTDGQYLLAKGDGRIAYCNWGPQLLWEGKAQGALRHGAVNSSRDQVLAASDSVVYSFNSEGKLLWGEVTEWTVQALHLDTTTHCIAASKSKTVSCLDRKGQPVWRHILRKTVQSVTISPDGQWILVGGEDGTVACLNHRGQVVWTSQLDKPIVSIGAGEGIVAVGDAGNIVHCLDDDGCELCQHEVGSKLRSVAVSAAGKHVAAGTEGELYQFFFTDAAVLFVPIRPKQGGAQNALQRIGLGNIQNVFMNHDGGCLLVEGKDDQRCYNLDGTLMWSCPKLDLGEILARQKEREEAERRRKEWEEAERRRKEREETERRRKEQLATELLTRSAAEQAARPAAEQAVKQIREAFTKHVYSQSSTKAREAKARQNIRLEGEILDLYFDGKGYLFVPVADLNTVRRAVKLAKRTNIYIIASDASNDVVQMVKRTRGVDLYRLSDMTKTTGLFGGSDFEPFMLAQGKMFTKK
jgi:hypothetical protein